MQVFRKYVFYNVLSIVFGIVLLLFIGKKRTKTPETFTEKLNLHDLICFRKSLDFILNN